MFTGIVEATGNIARRDIRAGICRITISAPDYAHRLRVGDSIAVSGTCLTALEVTPPLFSADLAAETLAWTTLGMLPPGSVVNLELPTPAGAPLGGHIVQGHVDGRGEVVRFDPVDQNVNPVETDWLLRVRVPEATRRFIVEKGSLALEGISLTVATWDREFVDIAVLPHTRSVTNLSFLRPGDPVNVEADSLMKLRLQNGLVSRPLVLTLQSLLANGF